jgi:hypothetical protein
MPNRIIKESICTSDSIAELNWFEEVLFYRLIVSCDDFGRFDGRVAVIKNRLFPLKDTVTAKAVETAIDKLVRVGLVTLYMFEGKPYLHLPTWERHQSIRAKKSKYPAPEDGEIASEIICKQMQANVPVIQSNPIRIQSESESESNSKAEPRKHFVPPSVSDVREYCLERGNSIDPQTFVDFYAGKNWMVGKTKMADWKACVRTWERRQAGEKKNDRPINPFMREEVCL